MTHATRTAFVAGRLVALDGDTLEQAVAAAAASASHIRALSSHDRASILEHVAGALQRDAAGLAAALAGEAGYLTVGDMQLEVQRAIEVFTLTAAHTRVGTSEQLNLDAVDRARGDIGYVRREPIGPILGITAFNGPLLIAAHKIAPAIAAGAPIIIKPSPRVPMSAVRLAEMVVASGLPAEGIAVLDADNEATMALILDPRLPVISFTGGDFGWTIKELTPRKKVHLELGGVGAVLIAADANIDLAARECAAGGFVRSGQSCIAVQRIYVERSAYGAFVDKLARHVKNLRSGEPGAIGPLVDEKAADRVERLIRDAVSKGATLVCGGERRGAHIEPTVLGAATTGMLVMRNEAFGPVVAAAPIDSIEEGIEMINAAPGAIHHGVYTSSLDLAFAAADRIRAGGVIINGPPTWRADHMPYGGVGASGFGREGVRYAIEEFTEPKSIVLRAPRLRAMQ
jgi:acyl-CoA reductase-like NAD-dependent aldehyde dehydrogenase